MANGRLEKLVAELATEFTTGDRRRRFTVAELVEEVQQRFPDVIEEETSRLVFNALSQAARRIVKALSSDEDEPEQLSLPDLHLPSTIAVRSEDGDTIYVPTQIATWEELLAGKVEREHNVDAAQRKLDFYNTALQRLAPLMENDPDCTVEDALRREGEGR